MRRVVVACTVLALMLATAGCSSSDEAASSSSDSASPSPSDTSTAEAVAWAGQVCTDIERVKTSVGALGRNTSYDITADRSALDQIQRQLMIQVLALGEAADALQKTLTQVPVDFMAANDLVVALQKGGTDTKEAAGEVGSHLSAATESGNLLTAAAEVGQALIAAKATFDAGQAFLGAIGEATSTTNAELRAAFDAAPQCDGA